MQTIAPVSATLPLTGGQMGIWLGCEFAGGDTNFNLAEAVDIHGPLAAEDFLAAMAELVREAEVTRTLLETGSDGPRLRVLAQFHGDISLVDFSAESDPRAAADAWMAQDYRHQGDIRRDPAYCAALLRLAAGHHVWYQRCHHLMLDGYGGGLIARRLAELYSARVQGRAPDEATAFAPLADLLAEEAAYRASGRHARDRRYWMDRFADTPEPASLATRRLPNQGGLRRESAWLSDARVRELRRIAQELDATLPQLLTACTCAYIGCMSGADDLVVGVPVTARHNERMRRVPGMVANAVPLRLALDPAQPLAGIVRETGRQMRQLLRHQAYRYEELRRDLNLLHSNRPLFTTVVNVEPFDYDFRYGDSPGTPRNLCNGTAEDLGIFFYDRGNGQDIQIDFDANPALYTSAALRGHLERLGRLIDALITDPQRALGQVELLAAPERRQVLQDWNETDWPLPPLTLTALLQSALTEHAPRAALCSESTTVDYAALDARSAALAARLVHRGAGPGRFVAVLLPRSIDLVVALLAVLRSGAAYLPLDPDYPAERLAFMLEDAQALAVVTDAAHAALLPGSAALPLLDVAATEEATAAVTPHAPAPGDPAYLIYTSGTTGRPKGVVNSHRAIVNRLLWMRQSLAIDHEDRVLQKTPSSFDVSVWEFFLPLLAGATLVLARPGGQRDPAYLAQLLSQQRISLVHFVPSMLEAFLLQPSLPPLPRLRHLVCSGEALAPALARRCRERLGCALHNYYGPTEAAVDVSYWPVAAAAANVPIGRPIWNTQLFILDAALRPLPPLARGELYIAGAGLGEGYLGRPELTAARFIANPYGRPGSRLYRTGDLASWNERGEIEYHGRRDGQIKLRGQRIELGEIEAVLARQSGVAQAAVALREDRLVAYVVAAADAELQPAALKQALLQQLPDYMLPGVYVFLAQLPLSPAGKLDRAALPAPARQAGAGHVAPSTPTETALAQLWAQTFNLEQIGVHDNFFELGGHSLLIVQLLSKIRERFQVELPPDTLFQISTIAELAQRLDQAAPQRPPLRPLPRRERPPLSFAQARWWFLNHLDGVAAACNMPLALRLSGDLDVAALQAALADLVERHESLRTVYPLHEGKPWQQVLPAALAQPTLRRAATREDALPAQLQAAADMGFALAHEVPLRAHLFALQRDEHVLLLLVHHIAADGASLAPLGRDLGLAYAARQRGEAPAWQPLPLHYADFAQWQEGLLRGDGGDDSMARQRAFWREALAGLPEQIALPWDRPRPAQPSHRGGVAALHISAAVHARLLQLARDTQASVFMLVQAGLASLLSRLGAGHDIPLGCAVAGRHDHQLEALIGCFVNTLVLRTDTAPEAGGRGPGLRELAARVRERNLAAYAHPDLPFDHLVELLAPARSRASHPLFQVMLGFQNSQLLDLALPGLAVTAQPVPRASAKFDLSFILTETRGSDGLPAGIQGGIEYNADLFDAATAQALARRFEDWLDQLSASPDEPYAQLPLLTTEEQRWLQQQLVPTQPAPPVQGLDDFVQRQAQRQPRAVAVHYGAEQLSYAGLNVRANRLAHLLARRGLGRGDLVACLFDCPLQRVVAQIAVAKCGAASLALEPAQAALRLRQLAAQGTAATLLAQSTPQCDLPAEITVLVLDDDAVAAQLRVQCGSDPDALTRPAPQAGDTAYVIFTSGSTGTPKAVAVPRRGLASLAAELVESLHIDARSRVLQYSSCAFDASLLDLLMAFAGGAALVLPLQARPLGEDLAQLLGEAAITHALVPPAALATLAPQPLPALRCLVLGGETCPPELVQRWSRGRQLFNAYGPTEATICCSLSAPLSHAVDAGSAVRQSELLVLDDALQPLPPGSIGELYIAGAGLAQGYLDQPWLTAQRFIANPHGAPGSRLYRSGDRARWNAKGKLELFGRSDAQLKIRGYRIEPGEIEAALASHAQVRQAAVLAHADTSGQPRLVAYALAQASSPPAVAALREHLAARLPDYLMPAAIVVLTQWPLGATGKLDRAALPPPCFDAASAFRPAQTPLQAALANLIGATLGLPQVGLDDNFFERGGHSLLALQAGQRIRNELDPAFPLTGIYSHPSVAELARLIEGGGAEEVPDPAADAQLAEVAGTAAEPLSPPRCVLLTGASGFVGSHLLNALLRDTDARVICPVRAADAAQARTRMREALALRRLPPLAESARVEVVVGDLEQTQLGLTPEVFARIAADCDLLLHCAARVDFLQPYARLRRANVDSVRTLVALTTQGRPKRLDFVSTLAVIGPDNPETVDEASALASWHGLVDGYSQSKWAADTLARQAQQRGLPVCIHRLGAVTGDRLHAVCNPADLIWRVTRLYADLGAVPDLDLSLNLTAADDVAAAIVALALRRDSLGRVFHLGSPQPLRAAEIPAAFAQLGQPLQSVPLELWRERARERLARTRDAELAAVIGILDRYDSARRYPRVSSAASEAALASAGAAIAPVDAALLLRYLENLGLGRREDAPLLLT